MARTNTNSLLMLIQKCVKPINKLHKVCTVESKIRESECSPEALTNIQGTKLHPNE